jgi:hypothetical protein
MDRYAITEGYLYGRFKYLSNRISNHLPLCRLRRVARLMTKLIHGLMQIGEQWNIVSKHSFETMMVHWSIG